MALRVLIAEDDPVLRAVAGGVLRAEGFLVEEAEDGQAGLEAFLHERPDLVLTDFDMPRMDGLALIRAIRQAAADDPVPIIMFTGGGRTGLLQESLDAGAIEFLTKPFSPDELRCRVKAIAEIVALHRHLAEAKSRDDEELAITKHVLTRLLEPGIASRPPRLWMETIATQRINGDACTYQQGLPDVHFGLVCDATGHGLTAGVSTIPVLEAFTTMASRDIPLESIYTEVNRKLRMMMPTGRFVCLLMLRLDVGNGHLSILNAGMPPAALLRKSQEGLRIVPSRNLPAGVLTDPGHVNVEDMDVAVGDRILGCSDGVVDLLGEEVFLSQLLEGGMPLAYDDHIQHIQTTITRHLGDAELHDDISYALWEVGNPTLRPTALKAENDPIPDRLVRGIGLELTLNPKMQQIRDILPHINTLLGYEHLAPGDGRTLALLLTESLTNALDHGVLGLSSSLKEEGFEAYDVERRNRLTRLEQGHIRLKLSLAHDPLDHRVRLVEVEVEDSGEGFDWESAMNRPPDLFRPSGRGLPLIRALARDVGYNPKGNRLSFKVPCG
jgi:CheY-like chemotaxis protein